MDFNKFADMLKRMGLLRHWIKQIAITGKGEPLLHPEFLKFCREVNRYKIAFSITTNGDNLFPSLCRELAKLEYLSYVRISVYDYDLKNFWLEKQKTAYIPIWLYNETGRHIDGMVDGFVLYTNPGTEKYCTVPKDFVTAKTCSVPFSFNTLNTDGSLVPCYAFFETGNVFTIPFWKVINSEQMRHFRKKALVMQAPTSNCKNCGYFLK